MAAQAPDPVRILAKERDYFDVRGNQEALWQLKRLYRLLGHEDNVSRFVGPTTHGYTQENREAMYEWFGRVTDNKHGKTEPEITLEKDEDLWCTPQGQVAVLEGTKAIYDFTRERSQQLAQQRKETDGDALLAAVKNVLKIDVVKPPQNQPAKNWPPYRILRSRRTREYPKPYACTYAVQTEPRILAIVYMLSTESWYSRPPREGNRAVLYVAHRSSDLELQQEPLIKEVIEAEPDAKFFAMDVRGIGESQPNTCGGNSFDNPYGCDYFYAIHSLMLDRPYLGQKAFDVLHVLAWLASNGYDDVHLIGKGWGALAATFAALLADSVHQVTLQNSLESYRVVAESTQYDWPLATLAPNVLAHFDLPDCYRALEPKQLRQLDPWGAMGEKTA